MNVSQIWSLSNLSYILTATFHQATHQPSLLTKAECADLSGLRVFWIRAWCRALWKIVEVMIQGSRALETRLAVSTLLSNQQHVPQVRDVAGGQPQCLNLRQLPVSWFGRYERPQRGERSVHTVRAIPLSGVCSVPRAYLDDLRTELAGSCYRSAAVPLFASAQLKCAVAVAGHSEGLVVRSRTLTAVVIIFGVHADLRAQEMTWGWSNHRKRHTQHLTGPSGLCSLSLHGNLYRIVLICTNTGVSTMSTLWSACEVTSFCKESCFRDPAMPDRVTSYSLIHKKCSFLHCHQLFGLTACQVASQDVCVNEFVSSRSFSSTCDFSWAFPYALNL